LAGHLAKLNQQLRHLLAAPLSPGAPIASAEPGPAQSVINRLRVAAALLAAPTRDRGAPSAPLQRLGMALGELVSGLAGAPGRLPDHLLPPMRQLAEFLGDVFDRLDRGDDPGDLCLDLRWETILAAFINAGTVLQTMDEIEEQMQTWSRRYGDQDLSASQEETLRRRWAQLRNLGDSLFGPIEPAPPTVNSEGDAAADLAGRRMLLLLASPFRKDQLRDRLRAMGCQVETSRNPRSMIARVRELQEPLVLLCDNLEPTHYLATVRDALAQLAPEQCPPLVLVASAGGSASRLRDRARHLGVQGTWADPFRPSDLIKALA
jgi:CheY-like chemotaxis protein